MRLSSVDLPALGGPAITTHSPSRRRSPRSAPASAAPISSASGRAIASARVDQILRHVAFVGEVDGGFDLRQRLDRARAPGFGAVAEQAAHLLERLPALRLGLGVDQVGQRLDLGEVELAVLEGAPGELARLRQPQPRDPAERRQHRRDHGAAAMQLKLGHVLAGLAARAGKPERQRLVDRLAGWRGRARSRAPPCAAPARGRSAPRARRGRAARRCRTTAIAAGGRPEERAKMVSLAAVTGDLYQQPRVEAHRERRP